MAALVNITEEEAAAGLCGIQKRMVSFGRGLRPDFESGKDVQVLIHWICRRSGSQAILDDTRKLFGQDKPMSLILGRQFRLPCLETCVKTMCVGEVASFTITEPSLLAPYPPVAANLRSVASGHSAHSRCCGGLSSGVGHADLDYLLQNPNEPLEFIMELIDVKFPGSYEPEGWQLSDDQRLKKAEDLKEEGAKYVTKGDYKGAADCYSQALDILDLLCTRDKPGEPEYNNIDIRKTAVYANLAMCQLHLGDYRGAIDSCSEAIRRDPAYVKAYYRRARAFAGIWEASNAFKDWIEVARLDPSLADLVSREAADFRHELAAKEQEEAHVLKNFFSSSK